MKFLKILLMILILIVICVVDILIYWNRHLYYDALRTEDTNRKINTLEEANLHFPFNDLVYYELGKTHYKTAVNTMGERDVSIKNLDKAISNFKHSIKINPGSQFSHFYLAQTLQYKNILDPSFGISAYEQYKKALLLVDENSQTFFEVGKIYLGRWSELSEEEREFAVNILKRIVSRRNRGLFPVLMNIWELNVKDYSVIDKILPEDDLIYRMYANFLGERSLQIDERHKYLIKAESLIFKMAIDDFHKGETDFYYYNLDDAYNNFNNCLRRLNNLRFYQNLTGDNSIDEVEFRELKKSCLLNLSKCGLEGGKQLADVEEFLSQYIALEDKVTEINKLESYLKNLRFIEDIAEENFDDLGNLRFLLFLSYCQNQYSDIMRIGRQFSQSFVVVPEEKKQDYVKLLNIIGDAFHRADYIYDAGEYYQKALETDPQNLETLLKIKRNYKRLNNAVKIDETDRKIAGLLSSSDIPIRRDKIDKGKHFYRTLVLNGQKILMEFHLKDIKNVTPLISIIFNGKIVWENYTTEEIFAVPLETRVGANQLQIIAINSELSLEKISYMFLN